MTVNDWKKFVEWRKQKSLELKDLPEIKEIVKKEKELLKKMKPQKKKVKFLFYESEVVVSPSFDEARIILWESQSLLMNKIAIYERHVPDLTLENYYNWKAGLLE